MGRDQGPPPRAGEEQTRARGALNAERRRLPMVRVGKDCVFDGTDGPVTLADLFGDRSQLIIQHVMFDPGWDTACPGCTASVDALPDQVLARLRSRDTSFALVSRAPLDGESAEEPGLSCFLRDGDEIFHTYSTYARGTEQLVPAYALLDLTAFGRSEDWEEPAGRARAPHGADPTFTD